MENKIVLVILAIFLPAGGSSTLGQFYEMDLPRDWLIVIGL